jgi:branched-chain amino acid transport system ATP-binding protein
MSSNALDLINLNKKFGRVIVAEGISFEVKSGEAFGIVGPNGAGKSTLLNLINGTEMLDSGEINFEGQRINNLSSAQRNHKGIARTFQIPRPFADMTVYENVLVGSTFQGNKMSHKAKSDLAIHSIERAGLTNFFNMPAGKLRLLDRKRLELARALACQPKVLLLDEIAGGLTDSELPILLNIIRDLNSQGVTIIWIEHIVHALVSVVNRLMCIAGGKVIAIGEPNAVLTDPKVIELYLGSDFEMGGVA